MSARYATALSHLVLAGTGVYCYVGVKGNPIFPQCSFGTIIVNSLLGIWRWGNPSYGRDLDKLYKFTSLLQDLLVLPCIVSTVYLQYDYMQEVALAYIAVSSLPIFTHIFHKHVNQEMLNTVVAANCLTLGTLSLIHENYYGIAACISYAFNYFVIKNDNETYFNMDSQDLYNYAMCFFAFFSLKTVLD